MSVSIKRSVTHDLSCMVYTMNVLNNADHHINDGGRPMFKVRAQVIDGHAPGCVRIFHGSAELTAMSWSQFKANIRYLTELKTAIESAVVP